MNQNYQKIIEKLGVGNFKLDEPMAEHTTFKIGGPADLFYEAETEEELVKVVEAIKEMEVPYSVLGGGSNILVGDKGFRGLIIKLSNGELKITNNTVLAGGSVPIAVLLDKCRENSLEGLEFMEGIPGTVGGAVRGNAGAWQKWIGESVSRVKIFTDDGEIRWLEQKDCQFTYRDSRFKRNKEIILAAEFEMSKGEMKAIEEKSRECLQKRACLPKEPSAGCIFVNPKPLSAGELIEKCGLKGTKIGQAQISEKHANFIINLGGARAVDVIGLIDLAKRTVGEKFNINLEEEIVRTGEF